MEILVVDVALLNNIQLEKKISFYDDIAVKKVGDIFVTKSYSEHSY